VHSLRPERAEKSVNLMAFQLKQVHLFQVALKNLLGPEIILIIFSDQESSRLG
jgi:hypothetical protein